MELYSVKVLCFGVVRYEFGEVLSVLNSRREFGEGSYRDRQLFL